MATRALPALLVAAALLSDGRLSFYLLVAAVPAAAVAALAAFGDLVELPGGAPGQWAARLHAALAGLALVLALVAAAAYGQAAAPALGASAGTGVLLLTAASGLAATLRRAHP